MLSVTGDYQNINKTNFIAILKGSFERSMSLAAIKNGFRKTGVYPFNSEVIDETGLIPIAPSLSSTPPIATSTLPGAAKMESTPTESTPETMKYWVGVQRGQSYLMGRRCLFSLGWQPF